LQCFRYFELLQQRFDPLRPRAAAGVGHMVLVMSHKARRHLFEDQMDVLASLFWIWE
jgi:hypothetical protein